jgi:hypothetical protein
MRSNDCNASATPLGTFADASPECLTCHQQDFNSTTNPNHQAAGFSTDCATCHTTAPGWSPATYDHTVWPLLGSHIPVSCDQCHNGNYSNTPNTCEGCHMPDYNSSVDPDHVTAGLPTDCGQCHNEGSWDNATFDHNLTDFPLTGMHVNVNCIECHAAGYTNTPTNCDACHMADYTGTVEPNHTQANFSNDCTQCHTTDGWTPSVVRSHERDRLPAERLACERELQPVPRERVQQHAEHLRGLSLERTTTAPRTRTTAKRFPASRRIARSATMKDHGRMPPSITTTRASR